MKTKGGLLNKTTPVCLPVMIITTSMATSAIMMIATTPMSAIAISRACYDAATEISSDE